MSLRAIASQTAHAPHRPHPRPGNEQGEVAPSLASTGSPMPTIAPRSGRSTCCPFVSPSSTTKRKPHSRRPRASARADESCNGRARVGREEAMIGYTFITAPSSPGSDRTVTPCATLTRCEDCGAEKDMRLDTLRRGARRRCKERARRPQSASAREPCGNTKAVQDLGDWINAVIRKHFVNVTLFVKSGEPRGHPHPPT